MQEIHCSCKTLDLMTVSEELANMTFKIKVDVYSHKSLQWFSTKYVVENYWKGDSIVDDSNLHNFQILI